ncbi:hypothetical protein PSTG_00547 [Puccinia striiformis f. sp. tritici PST-78]|uniref:Uncharacterized protein n=1 Tax=Puccinia striiformis f. sp. tritici PST-78 TaxID=1165861 RepID=A0A0L0W5C1_9BASI|nr:hypothetical protein PSTG_00547 [Puccinia striiformis f. sp. tritici PST-78]
MPISQNKLMPYSDNPSEIEESGTEPRKSRGTTTRKNRPSSRFKGRKFFQKWIMSSRRLKLPGQQHATHLRPNGSTNDPSGLPIKIRPVSFLFTHLDQHHNTGDPWFQSDKPCHPSYTQKSRDTSTSTIPWGDLLANELGCLAGYQLSQSLHRRYRDKLALSSLYEPLGAGGSNPRDLELSSEQDEDEENSHDRQDTSSKALFGADNPELSNVWSDRLEEGHKYFRFEEDKD